MSRVIRYSLFVILLVGLIGQAEASVSPDTKICELSVGATETPTSASLFTGLQSFISSYNEKRLSNRNCRELIRVLDPMEIPVSSQIRINNDPPGLINAINPGVNIRPCASGELGCEVSAGEKVVLDATFFAAKDCPIAVKKDAKVSLSSLTIRVSGTIEKAVCDLDGKALVAKQGQKFVSTDTKTVDLVNVVIEAATPPVDNDQDDDGVNDTGFQPCRGTQKVLGFSFPFPLGCRDNCPTVPNENQIDSDLDGLGDACDVAVVCGNNIIESGEQCDDGNTTAGDGCNATCQNENATCGNGTQEGLEQCDDGNTANNDGCNSACVTERCGDAITQTNEQCDDANTNNNDACLNTCQNAACGDGLVRTGVEQCDDGNTINTDACSNTCQAVAGQCGNGLVDQSNEQCDDGNINDNDACKNNCTLNNNVPSDLDTDGDGLTDALEIQIGTDPTKKNTDNDTLNGQSLDDGQDCAPTNPAIQLCSDVNVIEDPDFDNDGICDNPVNGTDPITGATCVPNGTSGDNCVAVPNGVAQGSSQLDSNGNGIGDACEFSADIDGDGDSLPDDLEEQVFHTDPTKSDTDGDGLSDSEEVNGFTFQGGRGPLDPDVDADGICDGPASVTIDGDVVCTSNQTTGLGDNCPLVFNPGQEDENSDGLGDACKTDFDGDTVENTKDNCPINANKNQTDFDKDGLGDTCDVDFSASLGAGGGQGCACRMGSASQGRPQDVIPFLVMALPLMAFRILRRKNEV